MNIRVYRFECYLSMHYSDDKNITLVTNCKNMYICNNNLKFLSSLQHSLSVLNRITYACKRK